MDGLYPCEDDNDDGDMWPDVVDECPLVAGAHEKFECTQVKVCAGTEWWLGCNFTGTGCLELMVKLYEVVNPVPTEVLFSRFEIVEQTMYIQSLPGGSVADISDLVMGGQTAGSGGEAAGTSAAPSTLWNLEIWTKDAAGWPQDFVSLVASYQPVDVVVGDVSTGGWLALDPPGAGPMTIAGTWTPGLAPGVIPDDEDGDGIPGFRDVCTLVADPDQNDRDGDWFGDVCDFDLDGDLWVGASDRLLIEGCLGVNLLAVDSPPYEGIGWPDLVLPEENDDWLEDLRRDRCRGYDLTGDGWIDDFDLALVVAAEGSFAGPSGYRSISATPMPGLLLAGVVVLTGVLTGTAVFTQRRYSDRQN